MDFFAVAFGRQGYQTTMDVICVLSGRTVASICFKGDKRKVRGQATRFATALSELLQDGVLYFDQLRDSCQTIDAYLPPWNILASSGGGL